ncbi:class I SAM-dependent methyltransferase [Hymenobacter actinosclerus]|uniref:Methyltransferase domain-containing protein n=1 Tax=Hymenobacter actinosclerus TaxID=82805 RepID=A0A1I0JH85_9BACT|nr:class I SAM-dependent methyltransferase [Hymenobacter actinosclerus]SEU08849.1 Methyltransferase domain-containing protein [Hymenobacter actinosclerus]
MILFSAPFFSGSKDIKHLLPAMLRRRKTEWIGKDILDVPAGNGDTSQLLLELGAKVTASDLYPEFFRYPDIPCVKANLNGALPFAAASFDVIICQEGIEHMPNQLHLFQEINRVLRPGGRAIITTPNYSNLRTRLSYLLLESEAYKLMPPNEADSVWASEHAQTIDDVYLGHIFFANITKQRVLAALSGLHIVEVHPTRVNYTSLALLPFYYPWMSLAGWLARRRGLRRGQPSPKRAAAYSELAQLNHSMTVLTGGHLMVEYEKRAEAPEVVAELGGLLNLATAKT